MIKYSKEIEKKIEKEIRIQKREDQFDERFFDDKTQKLRKTDEEYREWAIDNLKGNNIITN